MSVKHMAIALFAAVASAATVPDLRIEAVPAGSVLHLKNTSQQPLTSYVIELVGYPGSSFWSASEDLANPIAPGETKRIPITNMTVGAAPDYVKVTAAVYADGSSAGEPDKVAEILATRKEKLAKTRELIQRLQRAQSSGAPGAALVTEFKQWAASLQPQSRSARSTSKGRIQSAGAMLVSSTAMKLEQRSIADVIGELRAFENLMAAAKP